MSTEAENSIEKKMKRVGRPRSTARKNNRRCNSVDSRRSIGSSISSEQENDLLRSDEDEATHKIEKISDHLDSSTSRSSSAMEIDQPQQTSKPNDKINQNVSNDQIVKLLMDIKESQFTKKEGTALRKSFDTKFATIGTELKAHNDRISDIDERMSQFESKLVNATYERELHKQQLLKNNITIFGCPKQESENVTQVALAVFKAFGNEFVAGDFASVYRTAGKKPNFSSIVVKFVLFEKKLAAINTKAKKPIKVSDIYTGQQSKSQVYLNNHVTPFFGRLLAAGRQATKDEVIHSCWIGSNGCLIKIQEDGKPINIKSTDDLDLLRTKVNTQQQKNKRNQPDDPTTPTERKSKKRN